MKELNRFRQFLTEEDFKNPILDKYLELKKSIDYKTVFPTDLQSFVDSLDNTEREGLENDLAEGKINEDESEFERNTPDRIDQFIKELDALIEEYHAELYLKDDVFTGIEAVKMAALGENTSQD